MEPKRRSLEPEPGFIDLEPDEFSVKDATIHSTIMSVWVEWSL
jgi:hypothetical protein